MRRIAEADQYALVLFEDFRVVGVLMFPSDGLSPIGTALGKTGALPLDLGWDLTRVNWLAVLNDPDAFRRLNMEIFLPPDFADAIAAP